MKKLSILILLSISYSAFAQDSLQTLNYSRNRIKTTGMEVLGGWGISNIAIGGIGWGNTMGSTKYFYQMNTLWGVVNLGVAIAGFTSTRKNRNQQLTPAESLKEQHQTEKIFLINGGLDVVYMGTGFYLKHRGDMKNSDQLKGYGPALILQGAFLLLFDVAMYSTEKHNGNKLKRFLDNHPVTFDGNKVGMVIKL